LTEFDQRDFRRIRVTKEELAQFRENARRDLDIASGATQAEVVFEFAYKALIKLSIALVAEQGYKVNSASGHHVRLIEKLSELLEDENIMSVGNAMRSNRNQDFYGGGAMISEKDAAEYLDFVKQCFEKAG
jgi:hypothetical protein